VRKTQQATPPELDRLELTIRRLIESHGLLEKRAMAAEERIRDLEGAIQDVSAGRLDPVALGEEVQSLEQRNALLEDRLVRAHAAVERMMARLQFTAEER
jgi:predicted  nucleic acid-binding Zn-ribbon protein